MNNSWIISLTKGLRLSNGKLPTYLKATEVSSSIHGTASSYNLEKTAQCPHASSWDSPVIRWKNTLDRPYAVSAAKGMDTWLMRVADHSDARCAQAHITINDAAPETIPSAQTVVDHMLHHSRVVCKTKK